MYKNIERTVSTVDSLIDSARDAVVGASERAERGVGYAAEKVAAKAESAAEKVAVKAGVAAEQVAAKAGVAAEQVAAKAGAAAVGVASGAQIAAEKAHVAGEYLREGADNTARGAHQKLQGAADAIDRGYARVRSDVSRAADAASDYVAANTGKAVLMAASAGFLIGFLATRGRRALPA